MCAGHENKRWDTHPKQEMRNLNQMEPWPSGPGRKTRRANYRRMERGRHGRMWNRLHESGGCKKLKSAGCGYEERKTGASWIDLKTAATHGAALHHPMTPTSPLSPIQDWNFHQFCPGSPQFSDQLTWVNWSTSPGATRLWTRPTAEAACWAQRQNPGIMSQGFLIDPVLWSSCFIR